MPWGRLDDRLHDNGKVWSLTDRGFRVWMYSVSYCNAKRDKDPSGRLTQAEADAVCRLANSTTRGAIRKVTAELLAKRPPRDTSFWERDGSAFLVHDFPDFGPKLDLTSAERQRRRRGKGESHADVTRDRHGDVTHPVPVPGPVPHGASTQTEHIPRKETARAPEPIDRVHALAIPKPGLAPGSPQVALIAAFASAAGYAEPTTKSSRSKWIDGAQELLHATPPVTAEEIPGLVERYREENSVPVTLPGIAGQLPQLRSPHVASRTNGRRESTRAKLDRVFGSTA